MIDELDPIEIHTADGSFIEMMECTNWYDGPLQFVSDRIVLDYWNQYRKCLVFDSENEIYEYEGYFVWFMIEHNMGRDAFNEFDSTFVSWKDKYTKLAEIGKISVVISDSEKMYLIGEIPLETILTRGLE